MFVYNNVNFYISQRKITVNVLKFQTLFARQKGQDKQNSPDPDQTASQEAV